MPGKDKFPPRYFLFLGAYFINSIFDFFQTYAIPILLEGGVSSQAAALAQAAGYLLSAIAQIYFGRVLDEWRLRLAAIMILLPLFLGVCALAGGGQSQMTLMIGVGLLVMSTTARVTLATLCLESRLNETLQARGASIGYIALNAGASVGAVIAYLAWHSHRGLLLSVDAITTVAFTLFVVSELYRGKKPTIVPRAPSDFLAVWKLVPTLPVLLIFVNLCSYASAMPTFFASMGLETARATAVLCVVNTLSVVIFGALYLRLEKRFQSRVKLAAGCLCTAAGWVGLPYASSEWSLAPWIALWSLGEVLLVPEVSVIVYRQFGIGESGSAAASKVIAVRGGLIVAPLMAALLPYIGIFPFGWLMATFPLAAFLLVPTVKPFKK